MQTDHSRADASKFYRNLQSCMVCVEHQCCVGHRKILLGRIDLRALREKPRAVNKLSKRVHIVQSVENW